LRSVHAQGNFVNLSPSGIRERTLDDDGAALSRPAKEFAFPQTAILEGRLPDGLALTSLAALTAIVVWQRLWLWNGLAYLDVSAFYLPWYSFLGEGLRHFQIPGWNPHQFIGTPFAGDPQSGWMYFPAMFFFTLLPPIAAYKWFLIFHLALAGASTYAFARTLKMGVIGSLAAAAAYEFGPFVNHITCCLIHVQLAVWIPPALLGIELAHRSDRRWTRIAWWCCSGLAVSQIVAGWVGQGAYNGLLVVGTYAVFRTLIAPGRPRRLLARMVDTAFACGVVFASGLSLAAAGMLPRLAAVQETNVAGGHYTGTGSDNYSSGWSLSVLFTRFMSDGHDYFSVLFYLGGATIALAIAAPFIARRNYAIPYFTCLTIVVSTLTLAKPTIIHRLFFLLPKYQDLYEHVPNRVVPAQWIGPAILAGATIDILAKGSVDKHIRFVGAAILAIWTAVIIFLARQGGEIGWATLLVVAVVCCIFAVYASAPVLARLSHIDGTHLRRNLALLLLLTIVWEPTGRVFAGAVLSNQVDGVTQVATGPVSTNSIAVNAASTDPGGAGEFLQKVAAQGDSWRYFGYDDDLQYGGWSWPSTYREWYFSSEAESLLVNARAMMLGLDDVQGYNPVQLSRYVQFLNTLNNQSQNYHDAQILPGGLSSPLLNLLNARYIIIPNDLAAGRPRADLLALQAKYPVVFANSEVKILDNINALPRAWIVHDASRATIVTQLNVLADQQVDPARTALLANIDSLPSLALPGQPWRESVAVRNHDSDTMTLDANLQADGLVVVSEAYASGWNAYIDGRKTTIYLADGVLRAIAVPAGQHAVELRYEPKSLAVGLWISVAAGAVMLAVLALAFWERRRDLASPPRPVRRLAPVGD